MVEIAGSRSVQRPCGGDEVARVVSLVGAHGDAPRAVLLSGVQYEQGGIAFSVTIGVRDHRRGDQVVAVLDQHVTQIAQPRLLAVALPV